MRGLPLAPGGFTPRDTATDTPSGEHAQASAEDARELAGLRGQCLNPPEWVDCFSTPEKDAAGFPKRAVAKPGFEA